MAMMGKYCKSYRLDQFRRFPGWTENAQNARKVKTADGGHMQRQLSDQDFLYLHENFTATDGVFFDENIIFNDVTPEWIDFCRNTLGFRVPSDEVETAIPISAGPSYPLAN